MGPPSYVWSVVDLNIVMRRMTVHAHRYFTSPVHLVSSFFYYSYMQRVNKVTFADSDARKRGKHKLTATVKCVVDLSQIKPEWQPLRLNSVTGKEHFEVLCNK
jgi:hypothetical protein